MKHLLLVLIIFALSNSNYAQNPIADFEVEIEYKCNGSTAHYTNKSQYADSFLWNYDGHITANFEPRGFNRGGEKTWNVTLIAYGQGTSDTLSKDVYINNSRLLYSYELLDTNNFAPLVVQFHDESVIRSEDTILYSWDFGDGTSSDEKNPRHTYSEPGSYFVILDGKKNETCNMHSLYEIIVVRDTAQQGEFGYITAGCYGETEELPCSESRKFEFRNDSLIFSGQIYANCGTNKTATLRYSGDTIVIKTWEFGEETTCGCSFCFEIGIPNVNNDAVYVKFNNELHLATKTDIKDGFTIESDLIIYPNPSKDFLNIDISNNRGELKYEIIDLTGFVRQVGNVKADGIIVLNREKLYKGMYLLKLVVAKNETLIQKIMIE